MREDLDPNRCHALNYNEKDKIYIAAAKKQIMNLANVYSSCLRNKNKVEKKKETEKEFKKKYFRILP